MQLTATVGAGEVAQDCIHREGLNRGLPEMPWVPLAQHTFSRAQFPTPHSRDLSDFGLVWVWPEFPRILSGEGQAGSTISHFSAQLEECFRHRLAIHRRLRTNFGVSVCRAWVC